MNLIGFEISENLVNFLLSPQSADNMYLIKLPIQILIFKFFLVIIFGLPPLVWSAEAQKSSEKPNVVIIFADDMGYGDVSCLNPEARVFTPHIDHLAKKGITFTNGHSSASVCTPSRYGLLTGRYAWRSPSGGKVVNGFGKPVIEQDRETIASMLKKDGYTTACIGKWHLGLGWQSKDDADKAIFDSNTGFSNVDYTKRAGTGPNDYGFDYSFIHPASLDMPPYLFLRNHLATNPEMKLTSDIYPGQLDNTEYSWDKKHTNEHDIYWDKGVWWRRGEISRTFRVENCLSEILEDGISFVEKHANEKPSEPFFMYLSLTGPHTPWMPTEQFRGKTPIGTYGDFILDIDHVVGRVTETLSRLGIEDNTIIIFTSDNGAYWPQSEIELHKHDSNRGRRGQKGDVWDGGHRIPLIISWPSQIKEKIDYHHLVSLTDLFATIAELTDQKLVDNSGEDSFSFLPVLYGNTSKTTRQSMIHQSSGGMYSIRKDEWKYIEGLGSGGFSEPVSMEPIAGGPSGQLYHLKSDSLESNNLFLQYPDKIKELQILLKEQIEQGHSK